MKLFSLFRKNPLVQQIASDIGATTLALNSAYAEERRARNAHWWACATEAVERLVLRNRPFTADDVWYELRATRPEAQTTDNRAMGSVMQAACRDGLIVPTPEFRASNRRSTHRNPKRVWAPAPAGGIV